MKKMHYMLSASLLGFAASSAVMAEEASLGPTREAAAELGFVSTAGNSETETLNAKFDVSTSYDRWKHALHLETLNSSSDNTRSAEKYLASGQSDRAINDRSYFLSVATWEKDRFSGFDFQASIALGYGYKVIQEDTMSLSLEVAPGYRVNRFDAGFDEEDSILRAAESFSWKLSKTSTLDQSLNTEIGDSNTVTRFMISLTSQVADALSMKVGYAVKNNSDVPVGTDKTDSETSVTLVYKI